MILSPSLIGDLADAATRTTFSHTDLMGLRVSVLVHTIGGLVVLLTTATLATYKPAGLTPLGVRQQHEHCVARAAPDEAAIAFTPLWLKVFAAAGFVLLLIIGIMLFGGGHGADTHVS